MPWDVGGRGSPVWGCSVVVLTRLATHRGGVGAGSGHRSCSLEDRVRWGTEQFHRCPRRSVAKEAAFGRAIMAIMATNTQKVKEKWRLRPRFLAFRTDRTMHQLTTCPQTMS